MIAPQLTALAHLTEKVATELVFAKPGRDDALLPINSFICEMEELCATFPPASPLPAAVAKARALIDGILSSNGFFSEQTMALVRAWSQWMTELIAAVRDGRPAPEFSEFAGVQDCAEPLRLRIGADHELLAEFVGEAREHIQTIEASALSLESHAGEVEGLHAIFRAFHTIKGGAGFLELKQISRLTHEVETLLDSARTGQTRISAEFIELVLAAANTLKHFLDAIEGQLRGELPQAPIAISIEWLIHRISEFVAPNRAAETDHTEFFAPLGETAHFSNPARRNGSIKVDRRKVDHLLELVGELDPTQPAARKLRDAIMGLRLVSLRAPFDKMRRLAQDLAIREGKRVTVHTLGEDIELDRPIVDALSDALIHMIRNAVDHAIETPEVRKAAGKSPIGQIHLNAARKGDWLIAELSDDGRGLDKSRIVQKAVAKNIIAADDQLTDDQIFQLIFRPGFSTAEKITDLSGRGVGMDVVHRNVTSLDGRIDVYSREGHGTTFKIFIPLTINKESSGLAAGGADDHGRWSTEFDRETEFDCAFSNGSGPK